jgi:sulfate/thiosulfate transport system substrate-binding protein
MSGSARISYGLGIIVLLGLVPACHSTNSANTDVLRIGAYSVVREVLHDGILPAFRAKWKNRTLALGRFTPSNIPIRIRNAIE